MSITPYASAEEDLEQLRRGCTAALRRIFDRYYPELVAAVFYYTSDEESSKDIVQEVFTELWIRRQTLNIRLSLGAYLRRAAINRALNYLKTRQRYQFHDDTTPWQDLADLSEHDRQWKEHQDDLEMQLRHAIEQLPERCRIVFMLSRFEGMSHRAIAEQLGISVKTIENQLIRATRLLRQALESHRYLPVIVLLWIKYGLGQ
jgi:RNA polymerase sigma-70 factor (ECF subfamily)